MSAVWLRAKAQLRGRLLASLLLALLVGLAGGVVLAAVAGARRSDAALPRFLAASQTTDVTVWILGPRGGQPARTDLAAELRAVAALPQVRTAQRGVGLIVSASDPAKPSSPRRQLAWVGVDRVGSDLFNRPRLVAGRLPRPDRADETVIDEEFAWRHRLGTGASFRVGTYTRTQFGPAGEGVPIPPKGPSAELRVTGILRSPEDLVPVNEGREEVDVDESSQLYLTPAFWRRYGPDLANYGMLIAVDLRRGPADLPAFTAAVQRRFPGQAHLQSGEFAEQASLAVGVRRAIALETAALLAFATLAGLAVLLLVGQTLGRQILLESAEYPTLRALGMTGGQLIGVALVRAVVIGVAGSAVALAVALALSPLTPIGVARRADLDPGMAADRPVLVAGGLAIVALVAVGTALPAWRAALARSDAAGVIDPAGAGRPSRAAEALAAAGAPPSAITGVRFALEPGRGRTAVPVRAALAGAVAAVCTVTAAAGFGASLARLGQNPAGYGVTWDAAVGAFASAAAGEPVLDRLLDDPAVAAVAADFGFIDSTVDGRYVPLTAIEDRKGRLAPALIEGREPLRPDEIALGSLTLRALRKRVGDTITLTGARGPMGHLRVVGQVVLSRPNFDSVMTPGRGGVVQVEVIRRLFPPSVEVYPGSFLVRLDPDADRARVIARFRREFGGYALAPRPHADIRNLQRVAALPGLLAAMVALVALGAMTHALVTSVRRRRRDLAVLKTLGFARGQVAATIAWQATTFAVVALAFGLPLGVAAGRWAWQLTADALGVSSAPVLSLTALLVVVAGTVLAANLVAAGPGRAASRLRPAAALRSE